LLGAMLGRGRGPRPVRATSHVCHQRPWPVHRPGGRHVWFEQRLLLEELSHGDEPLRPHRRMHSGVRAVLLGWFVLLRKLQGRPFRRPRMSASGRQSLRPRGRDLRREWRLLSRQHVHARGRAHGTHAVRLAARRRVSRRWPPMRSCRSVLRRQGRRLLRSVERGLPRVRVFMPSGRRGLHSALGLLRDLDWRVELPEPRWRLGVRRGHPVMLPVGSPRGAQSTPASPASVPASGDGGEHAFVHAPSPHEL